MMVKNGFRLIEDFLNKNLKDWLKDSQGNSIPVKRFLKHVLLIVLCIFSIGFYFELNKVFTIFFPRDLNDSSQTLYTEFLLFPVDDSSEIINYYDQERPLDGKIISVTIKTNKTLEEYKTMLSESGWKFNSRTSFEKNKMIISIYEINGFIKVRFTENAWH